MSIIIPIKFRERYKKLFDSHSEYKEFMNALIKPLIPTIRITTLKYNPKETFKLIKKFLIKRMDWYKWGFFTNYQDVGNTLEHHLGMIYSQDGASMLPPLILNPKEEDKVLDMCAAPGSKTTLLAELMKNKGLIIANDDNYYRLKSLVGNIERIGALNVAITNYDGYFFKNYENYFDKVLVDAPCSSEGTIKRTWNVLSRWNINTINNHAKIQKRLIYAGFKTLKKEGILVYSTCTFAPEENEAVVDFLLKKFSNAEIEEIKINMKTKPGLIKWKNENYNKDIEKTIRIYPHLSDVEGFYIAKIRKI